ncbi:hypothetical protein ACYOEI_04965 [Singulisphaera rosea]
MSSPLRSARPIAWILGAWLCLAALLIVLGSSWNRDSPRTDSEVPRHATLHREHGLHSKTVAVSALDRERLDGLEDDDERWKTFKPVKGLSSRPTTIRQERPSSSGLPPRTLASSPLGSSTTRLRC